MKKQFLAGIRAVALVLLCCAGPAPLAAQSEYPTPTAQHRRHRNAIAAGTDAIPQADADATATAVAMIAIIQPQEHHFLRRPILVEEDLIHWPDRSYPYGSTQLGALPVHLGVEFVNRRGTPVYASGAGDVIFAGSDNETWLGPQLDYYGNVVILAHDLESLEGNPVFTLYGHLDSLNVSKGQFVADGALLGKIGSTGVAIGAHLHYEVRVADPFDYRNTRNPELWLQYYVDNGMVAGLIHDENGAAIAEKRLVLRSGVLSREVYTYSGELVNSDPVWGENFTVGDLPAGEYEIVVLKENGAIAFREQVQVEAYSTTFVEIEINE